MDHDDDGETSYNTFVDDVAFEPTYLQALLTAAGRNVATFSLFCLVAPLLSVLWTWHSLWSVALVMKLNLHVMSLAYAGFHGGGGRSDPLSSPLFHSPPFFFYSFLSRPFPFALASPQLGERCELPRGSPDGARPLNAFGYIFRSKVAHVMVLH